MKSLLTSLAAVLGIVLPADADLLINPSGGATLSFSAADDSVSSGRSLGFTGSFFGSTVNSVDVSTNGNVNFSGDTSYSNGTLQSSIARIAPLWDDLQLYSGDSVTEKRSAGVYYSVTWNGVGNYLDSSVNHTFQAVWFGSTMAKNGFSFGSNDIAFSYEAPIGAFYAGAATVGLSSGTGPLVASVQGVSDGYLLDAQSNLLPTGANSLILFRPNGAGGYVSSVVTLNPGATILSSGQLLVNNATPINHSGNTNVNGGTLQISSGGSISNYQGIIGESSGQSGAAIITGAGSEWISADDLRVGNSGSGTLTIQSGGMATSLAGVVGTHAGSTGTATVTGSGSQWNNTQALYVGYIGNGTLNVQNGGTVSSSGGTVARYSGSVGAVNVTGTGSQWTMNGDLEVGTEGTGTLNIQSGGKVTNTTGYIAFASGITGSTTVTGADSQWISSGGVYVGYSGNGTLNVQSGGKAESSFAIIGELSGGTGTVTVDGASSLWKSNGNLEVGSLGAGTLNIQNSGKVTSFTTYIGNRASSTSTATVSSSGEWTTTGLLIGNEGTGTLTVNSGGKVTATSVSLASSGTAKATVNLNGTVGSRGVLETSFLSEGSGTQGATINFNGGILRATGNQTDFLRNFESGDVQIQSGGAFIDTNGFNVTVNSTAQFGGTGGITKQGGGTLTLSGDRNYNGSNMVEAGTLANASGNLGVGNTSSMTVSGSGSQWTNSGNLVAGSGGNGTLNVQSAGVVTSSFGNVALGGGSTGTVTVTGAGSQWASSVDLNLGYHGTGSLNVQSGGVVSTGIGRVGREAGSTGNVSVSSAGSLWSMSSTLTIGDAGTGTLTADAGGKTTASSVALASSGSATGTLNLNGTSGNRGVLETAFIIEGTGTGGGTINFNGGILRATGNQANFLQNFESGDVQIQSGGAFFDTNGFNVTVNSTAQFGGTGGITKQGAGTLTLSGDRTYNGSNTVEAGTLANEIGYLGQSVGTTSSMIVTGFGSQWTNSDRLYVGFSGNGTLNVESGGVVSNTYARIASDNGSTGTATVTGSGSQWNSSSELFVGYSGNGTLNIENGGIVSNTAGHIGRDSDGTGTATVTGSGSQWNSSNELRVGYSGNGTLTVDAGGKVTAVAVVMASDSAGQGTLNLNGTAGSRGVLETSYLSEGSGSQGATINFNGGILRASGNQADFLQNFESSDVQIQGGGAFIDTQSFNVGIATALQGTGGLTKEGAGTLTLSGTSAYGGNTTVEGGTLLIAGGGTLTNGAGFDIAAGAVLDVTSGTATLGGDYNSGSDVFGEIYVRAGGTFDNRDTSGVGAQGGSFRLRGGVVTGSFDPNAGLLQFADSSTLIEGYGTLSAGTSLLNTATLQSSGGTLMVNGAVGGGGTVAALAGSTLQLNGGNGTWGGVSTLNVSGTAQLGANFSATTTTVHSGGALHLNGNTLTTAVTVAAGGAVVSGGGTVAGNTILNGTGISGGGALVNSGTSTFAGQVTVATDATINAGGGTLNLNGGLVKNGTTSTILGGGTVIVNGTGISGSAPNSDLVVDGTTLVVNAESNYNGPTTVQNNGTLVANAAVISTQVTVTNNSTLSGTGSIDNGTGYVFLNGALVVGDTTLGSPVVSQLEISGTGSTVLGGSSTLAFDIFTGAGLGNNTGNATSADRLRLFGTLDATLGGTLVLGNPAALTGFAMGDEWLLVDLQGGASITGALGLDCSALNLGVGLVGSFDEGTGIFSINAVPEPSRAMLLMLGAAAMLLRRRRQV